MKIINLTMTILLTISCASCKGPQIRPQVNGDISINFNRCRVRCFSLMEAKTVEDKKCNRYYKINRSPDVFAEYYELEQTRKQDVLKFVSGNYPLNVCDKMTGVFAEPFAKEIKPWAKKTIQYYKDRRR